MDEETPVTMEIFKVESFTDNQGKTLDVFIRVNEAMEPVSVARIVGHASFQIKQRMPDGREINQMIPVDFDIPTDSLQEAFLAFEEAAKSAAKEVGDQIKKSHEEHEKKVRIHRPGEVSHPPPDLRRLPQDGRGPFKRPFLGG